MLPGKEVQRLLATEGLDGGAGELLTAVERQPRDLESDPKVGFEEAFHALKCPDV